jgi:hypothetical protein
MENKEGIIENDIEDTLNLLKEFIISNIQNLEIIDISKYDGSVEIIRNEIEKYNNNIEEKLWKDEKYYNDKNIFVEKILYYQKSIKMYEDYSYIKFK